MIQRFTLFLRDGSQVTGAIQGSGGLVASRDCRRIANAIDHALDGRDTGLYEPQPGFVRVFPNPTSRDAGEHVDVDVRQCRGVSIVADDERAS